MAHYPKIFDFTGSQSTGSQSIDINEVAFGTGIGITSSDNFKYFSQFENLLVATGSSFSTDVFNSSIISGNSNYIGDNPSISCNSTIITSCNSQILSSQNSSIISSIGSTISCLSFQSSIISDSNSTISEFSCNSTILSGLNNEINISCNILISGKNNSSICSSDILISGENNKSLWNKNSIIQGIGNTASGDISSHGYLSAIISSKDSLIISDCSYLFGRNSIIGSLGSMIKGDCVSGNLISGGMYNIIDCSSSDNFLSGFCNCIYSSSNSAIIGGFGLTLSNESSVLYVPELKIFTASNTNSTRLLVWDNDNYVKYRDESTLSGDIKSGNIVGGSFSTGGTTSVSFITSMSNTDYSITVTGEVSRAWSIEDKTINGFTINANSSTTFVENVYWQAIPYKNI